MTDVVDIVHALRGNHGYKEMPGPNWYFGSSYKGVELLVLLDTSERERKDSTNDIGLQLVSHRMSRSLLSHLQLVRTTRDKCFYHASPTLLHLFYAMYIPE